MPMSYMGTKRHLAATVRDTIAGLEPAGPVVDLFGGMGSVAEALAPDYPVVSNDLLSFATAISAARFCSEPTDVEKVRASIRPRFEEHRQWLRAKFARRLAGEAKALAGGPESLGEWMANAPVVATSDHYRRMAVAAASDRSRDRFQLATLYFSAGYFSTYQAIDLDALRYAIERTGSGSVGAIAAWLVAASRIANSPGHTAQFLRPNAWSSFNRVRATFARSVWRNFSAALLDIQPIGTAAWRARNSVTNCDALSFFQSHVGDVSAIYADPPYSRDQYARYYHVQESLFRYDFPGSAGRGRGPIAARPSSGFSRASAVVSSFEQLFAQVAKAGVPLVLSYPSRGLLQSRGMEPAEVAAPWMQLAAETMLPHQHSTLGAASGIARSDVFEHIYTFVPRT